MAKLSSAQHGKAQHGKAQPAIHMLPPFYEPLCESVCVTKGNLLLTKLQKNTGLPLKINKPKIGCCDRLQVGWFLHTPFPSSEIYRTLPVREEVLRAVLKADLIGFHTYDYARHFVSACTRILGLEVCLSAEYHF